MAQKPVKQKNSRLKNFFYNNKKLRTGRLIVSLVIFAGFGVYLTTYIMALPSNGLPKENPARGLRYRGVKKATKGPCAGTFVFSDEDEEAHNVRCTHPDPGPRDIDVQARLKTIDSELSDQLSKDKRLKPLSSNAPASADPINRNPDVANEAISASNMNSILPRNWPCVGTGFDGYRIKLFYAYPSGVANNIKYYRPIFETIARRMNAVMYNSAVASGDSNGMQIRFGTNNTCVLTIQAIKLSGDINNLNNIRNQMQAAGYIKSTWKDLIWIDGGTNCGQGEVYNDDSPSQSNLNNTGGTIAAVWKGCWNYGEPHELMHMLGSVQKSAPHATKYYHCYDEFDIMCYDDGSGIGMVYSCKTLPALWRYDCNHNDYFDAASPKGYLSSHWNAAKNRFLIP